MTVNSSVDRATLVNMIRRWGNDATDAVLDPACQHFFQMELPGVVGYRKDGNYVVVYGDPICSPENSHTLWESFTQFCGNNFYSPLYLMISEQLAHWAIQKNLCNVSMYLADKLWLNPQMNPLDNTGRHGSLLRRKTKHALREGIEVSEYLTSDLEIEEAMSQVANNWLKSRSGPQFHISNVHLFEDRQGKRWFYAHREGKVVGVVLLNQLQGKSGWLLNHLMITPDCSPGTQELLVIKALETVANEGCEYVTFGACPISGINEIFGLNGFMKLLAKWGYQIARTIFHLDGLSEFWSKFQPHTEKIFILFNRDKFTLKGIFSLLRALNVIK